MMQKYDIIYNQTNDIWSIYKIPSKNSVTVETAKYGIVVHRDINNEITCIDFPEPDILFGIKDIAKF